MATAAVDASTFPIGANFELSDFDFNGDLIDSIDLDDLFDGLPDFETEYLTTGSSSGCDDECSEINVSAVTEEEEEEEEEEKLAEFMALIDEAMTATATTESLSSGEDRGDEEEMVESEKKQESVGVTSADRNRRKPRGNCRRGKSDEGNNYEGKRKVKVDWTPELHRRFVEAVEKLGVDKAVPSRILEMMGIDCLTRHNVASHLQKYRSRRKHLVVRETEAASWSQKMDMYGVVVTGGKDIIRPPWHVPPIVGFPSSGVRPMHPGFRPLHVWGHPSSNVWPRHLAASPSPAPPRPAWPPLPHYPPVGHSFWHRQQVPYTLAPPGPCFPPALPPTRFPAPPVPGIPPHVLYRPSHSMGQPPATSPGLGHPPPGSDPTKESVDAVIGDVLAKPWLPLPIGLKPPSVDSVLVELQRQGVAEIPSPTLACA